MNHPVDLNSKISTGRNLWKLSPAKVLKDLQNDKKSTDEFETLLFIPDNKDRISEGGFRKKGYFKKNDEKKPLITIITVVFNNGPCLQKTILSVLNQNYENIEYILIDGGSTDETLSILRKYDFALDYWVSEKDNGIYDAMNKGCRLSMGSGLIFLNSGVKFIGQVLNKQCIIPSLLPCRVLENHQKIWKREISDPTLGMPTSHQAMLFKNKRKLFDLKYRVSSDYDYFIRHGAFSNYDNNCLGYVLYENNGFSKNNKIKRDLDTFKIIFNYFGLTKALKFIKKQFIKFILNIL